MQWPSVGGGCATVCIKDLNGVGCKRANKFLVMSPMRLWKRLFDRKMKSTLHSFCDWDDVIFPVRWMESVFVRL